MTRDLGDGLRPQSVASGHRLRLLTIVDIFFRSHQCCSHSSAPQQRRRGDTGKGLQSKPSDNTFIEALNGASGTNASTRTGSPALRTPKKKWRLGEDTTTKNGPMARSATDRPFCCKTTSAHPAHRRDQGETIQFWVVQNSVSLQKP